MYCGLQVADCGLKEKSKIKIFNSFIRIIRNPQSAIRNLVMSEHTEHAEHKVSLGTYFAVFVALLVFTALTVFVAFFDLGYLNNVVALGIAAIKATLVVLFFMHVKYSSRLTKLIVVAGLFWLAILLILTSTDYLSRGWMYTKTPFANMQ